MLQRRIKLGICWGEGRERNVSKASLRRYLEQNHRKPGDVGRPGSSPGEEGPGEVQGRRDQGKCRRRWVWELARRS